MQYVDEAEFKTQLNFICKFYSEFIFILLLLRGHQRYPNTVIHTDVMTESLDDKSHVIWRSEQRREPTLCSQKYSAAWVGSVSFLQSQGKPHSRQITAASTLPTSLILWHIQKHFLLILHYSWDMIPIDHIYTQRKAKILLYFLLGNPNITYGLLKYCELCSEMHSLKVH